jgi:hypothetical protein
MIEPMTDDHRKPLNKLASCVFSEATTANRLLKVGIITIDVTTKNTVKNLSSWAVASALTLEITDPPVHCFVLSKIINLPSRIPIHYFCLNCLKELIFSVRYLYIKENASLSKMQISPPYNVSLVACQCRYKP